MSQCFGTILNAGRKCFEAGVTQEALIEFERTVRRCAVAAYVGKSVPGYIEDESKVLGFLCGAWEKQPDSPQALLAVFVRQAFKEALLVKRKAFSTEWQKALLIQRAWRRYAQAIKP